MLATPKEKANDLLVFCDGISSQMTRYVKSRVVAEGILNNTLARVVRFGRQQMINLVTLTPIKRHPESKYKHLSLWQ